jgi:tRNA (mo5U34)-methyltransferase
VEFLPELTPHRLDLAQRHRRKRNAAPAGQINRIETLMRNLMPWRKGPFSLYGVNIDTEWRSDWKWDRVCRTCPT